MIGGPGVAGAAIGLAAALAVRAALRPRTDRKGRGSAYLRGHAEGRLAQRAGVPRGERTP